MSRTTAPEQKRKCFHFFFIKTTLFMSIVPALTHIRTHTEPIPVQQGDSEMTRDPMGVACKGVNLQCLHWRVTTLRPVKGLNLGRVNLPFMSHPSPSGQTRRAHGRGVRFLQIFSEARVFLFFSVFSSSVELGHKRQVIHCCQLVVHYYINWGIREVVVSERLSVEWWMT